MYLIRILFCSIFSFLCFGALETDANPPGKIKVIFDTDANNELDDQHALAYLLFNSNKFDVKGITVNATRNGGDISEHVKEAERVMKLCKSYGMIPLLAGANRNFKDISEKLELGKFDGQQAVDFLIKEALNNKGKKLVVLAVGKLTNPALALKLKPAIASKIKILWLGSNYPDPGEYNLDDDVDALNFVLSTKVEFEMVVVRYTANSGSAAVRAKLGDIRKIMPGKGPQISEPVQGRHGKYVNSFGDYSVDLFNHIEVYLQDSSRALFDMTAVAILKNSSWGKPVQISAPYYQSAPGKWIEHPGNKRKIKYWEHFNTEAIMNDFYESMLHFKLPG